MFSVEGCRMTIRVVLGPQRRENVERWLFGPEESNIISSGDPNSEASLPSNPFDCNEFRKERRGSIYFTSVHDDESSSSWVIAYLHKSVSRVVPSPISSPSIDSIVEAPSPLPSTTHSIQRATIRSLSFPL